MHKLDLGPVYISWVIGSSSQADNQDTLLFTPVSILHLQGFQLTPCIQIFLHHFYVISARWSKGLAHSYDFSSVTRQAPGLFSTAQLRKCFEN